MSIMDASGDWKNPYRPTSPKFSIARENRSFVEKTNAKYEDRGQKPNFFFLTLFKNYRKTLRRSSSSSSLSLSFSQQKNIRKVRPRISTNTPINEHTLSLSLSLSNSRSVLTLFLNDCRPLQLLRTRAFFSTQAPTLKRLNGICIIFERKSRRYLLKKSSLGNCRSRK